MPDAATIAVLRDMAMLIVIALGLGVAAYSYARRNPSVFGWNRQGNVSVLQFDLPDAVFVALLLFMLLGGLLIGETSEKPAVAAPQAPFHEPFSVTLAQIMTMLMGAAVIVLWFKLVRQFRLRELFGLRLLKPKQVFVIAVFWIVPSMILVAFAHEGIARLLQDVWPVDDPQEVVKSFQSTTSLPTRILMGLAAAVFAPLTEELMFRGVIYGVCKRYTDSWFAVLLTSLLFATVHMHVGSFVPLLILAIALNAAYEYTGCLLVPMAMHAIFNSWMLFWMMWE